MNPAQNVYLDVFLVKSETGSLGVKTLDHQAKSKEDLVNTLGVECLKQSS